MTRDVLILGSGPAAYTAALYASRASLSVEIIEGPEPGGQLMITTDVENFPGFPEGILGPELMEKLKQQAARFGTEMRFGTVTEVDFSARPFKVTVDGRETLEGRAVIVATGASARWLGLESEQQLRGFGVSACATCDGFFFKDKELVIVGGGDSAMEEAIFLTRFATKVTVVHRRDELRASKIMRQRAFDNEKIDFLWNKTISEILTETGKEVTGIRVKDTENGEESDYPCQGVFLAIGHDPNTSVVKDHIETDESGYIVPSRFTMTSVPGVFAAGDCVDHRYRQAITAAAMGCQSAIDAERWLEAGEI